MKSENNFSGLLEMIVAIIVKSKKIDIKSKEWIAYDVTIYENNEVIFR